MCLCNPKYNNYISAILINCSLELHLIASKRNKMLIFSIRWSKYGALQNVTKRPTHVPSNLLALCHTLGHRWSPRSFLAYGKSTL